MAKDDEILSILNRLMDEHRDARSETSKAISNLDKKVDLHIQKTEYELKGIREMDDIQNKLLDQHIEGVNTLKLIHDEHVKENNIRFSKLEEPRKFLKTMTRIVLWLGGIGTAAIGIAELIARLKG